MSDCDLVSLIDESIFTTIDLFLNLANGHDYNHDSIDDGIYKSLTDPGHEQQQQQQSRGGMHGHVGGMEERLEDAINILKTHADVISYPNQQQQQQSSASSTSQLTQLDCHVVSLITKSNSTSLYCL